MLQFRGDGDGLLGREDQIDDQFERGHQRGVGQCVEDAADQTEDQPRPIRFDKTQNPPKKRNHYWWESMLERCRERERFSGIA